MYFSTVIRKVNNLTISSQGGMIVTYRTKPMKTAQLTPNIRYVSLTDDDGDFGILLHHFNGQVLNAYEVYDREHFTRVYDELVQLTNSQY